MRNEVNIVTFTQNLKPKDLFIHKLTSNRLTWLSFNLFAPAEFYEINDSLNKFQTISNFKKCGEQYLTLPFVSSNVSSICLESNIKV